MPKHFTYDQLSEMIETLVLETTIGARGSDNPKTFQVRAADMALNSIAKSLRYGFQRWLNDRVGGDSMTYDEKIADTEIFLATVMDGTWAINARGPKASADPLARYRSRVAILRLKKAGLWPKGIKGDDATKLVADYIAAHADAVERAATTLRNAELAVADIDADVEL
jgi:hypothetical protein